MYDCLGQNELEHKTVEILKNKQISEETPVKLGKRKSVKHNKSTIDLSNKVQEKPKFNLIQKKKDNWKP